MSTLALRNYGLVLPKNYVSIDSTEMEYIDGGTYVSAYTCRNIFAALAISPAVVFTAVYAYASILKIATSIGKKIGGAIGFVVATAIDYAASQVAILVTAFAYGAINNGVDVWWNWKFWKAPLGVNYDVKY